MPFQGFGFLQGFVIGFQIFGGMRELCLVFLSILLILATLEEVASHGDQPLKKIDVQKASFALNHQAYIKVSPTVLGLKVSFFPVAKAIKFFRKEKD